MYAVIAFLALIALVVGGIVLFNALSKDKQPTNFTMPNVVGSTLEEGTKVLSEAGLQVNPIIQEPADPAFPDGSIVRTEPIAERELQRIDQDRLAGAGFTGQHVQASPQIKGQPIDDQHIPNIKRAQHLMPPKGAQSRRRVPALQPLALDHLTVDR